MKLECTIGTQGLSDGRIFSRGDVYETDDDTASVLVAAGYAKPVDVPDVCVPPVDKPIVDVKPDDVPITRNPQTRRKRVTKE